MKKWTPGACTYGVVRRKQQGDEAYVIFELAKPEDLHTVYNVVQHTIKTIYPKYYPMEVVDFFCEHHSEDAIAKDIKNAFM